jgi:hypothetical protein
MKKFYGNGQVWDKANRKILCVFEKLNLDDPIGTFCTEDLRIIDILQELGYKNEDVVEEIEDINKSKKGGVKK